MRAQSVCRDVTEKHAKAVAEGGDNPADNAPFDMGLQARAVPHAWLGSL